MQEEHRNDSMAFDVLIVIGHYLPGRLAGGPVTTIENLTRRLGNKVKFLIITHNYDLDGKIYPNIELDTVYRSEGVDVIYLNGRRFGPKTFYSLLIRYSIPVLYLNSFFSMSTIKTLIYSRAVVFGTHIIVAPRGEFSAGALALKRFKKRTYLWIFKTLGLAASVSTFQASTSFEMRDIHRVLGPVAVKVAVDLAPIVEDMPRKTASGHNRVVFVSRISPMKNLLYAIEVIRQIGLPLDFHIYGPAEDRGYWEQCQQALGTLPAHIQVAYRGALDHQDVRDTLSLYDVFLFPTLGENYGHVIWEALAAGCPVVLSDQTPWQDLRSAGVGDVLPLSNPQQFAEAVTALLLESPERRLERSAACTAYARRVAEDPNTLQENLELFELR